MTVVSTFVVTKNMKLQAMFITLICSYKTIVKWCLYEILKNVLFQLCFFVLCIRATFSLVGLASGELSGVSEISVTSSSYQLKPGESFTIDVNIIPDEPISGTQFSLSFEGTGYRVNEVKDGYLSATKAANIIVVSPNTVTVADINGSYDAKAGRKIRFDSSESYDPDGNIDLPFLKPCTKDIHWADKIKDHKYIIYDDQDPNSNQ